jgi:hypothetical protein
MTDFSNALLSLREPMTGAQRGRPRAETLLATRSAILSSSPLSNPMLAAATVTDWPDAVVLQGLIEDAQSEDMVVWPTTYFQLAFPVDAAPTDLPSSVTFLGFDVSDGADTYLLDYGELPAPLGVPPEELNEVGLLDRREDAEALVARLSGEWALDAADLPQVLALYRVTMPA